MTKAIHAANSPPDVASPKGAGQPDGGLLAVVDQEAPNSDHERLTEEIVGEVLAVLEAELKHDLETLVPRPNLLPPRQPPSIKFFEKKGIKTDLFAIEKYVDEVLEEVKSNRREFMVEINSPLSKDARAALF